ncbi:MAG: PAS domain S-box protein [Myxococcota bacterium]|nr:PAS domain S-box protein [Myxococcota bacterium]
MKVDLGAQILEQLFEGCQLIAPDYRYLYVNDAVLEHAQRSREELLGHTMLELYPGIEQTALFARLRATMQDGQRRQLENEFVYPDGSRRWFELNIQSCPEGVIVLSLDIDQRKRAERAARGAMRALKVLSACNRHLLNTAGRVPSDTSEGPHSSLETEPGWLEHQERSFIQGICELLVERGGYAMAWVGQKVQDAVRSVQPVASAGQDTGYTATAKVEWGEGARGAGPAGTAIRSGHASVVRFVDSAEDFAPWRQEAQARGFASVLALPVVVEGEVYGALVIYSSEPDAFHQDELELLEELALDLGFGLGTLRARAARAQAEAKVRHLNAVLHGIRHVNQLITRERDPQSLIQRACELLVASRGFLGSAIVLTGPSFEVQAFATTGKAAEIGAMLRMVKAGTLPQCMLRALQDGLRLCQSGEPGCEDCDARPEGSRHRSTIATRLECAGKALGALLVSLPEWMEAESEELELLVEVAGDLAFALDGIRQSEAKVLAERALAQEQARYEALVQNLEDVVFSADVQGFVRYMSPAVERVYGFSQEEVVGQHFSAFILPEDLPGLAESFARTLAGRNQPYVFRAYDKHGRLRSLRSMSKVRVENGKPVGIDGVIVDFTELEQAKAQLRRLAEHWAGTFDAITDTVALVSPEHEVLDINAAGCSLLGLPKAEILGKKCFSLFHGGDAPVAGCSCVRSLQTLAPASGTLEERGRSYEITSWPILTPGQEMQAFVHVIKDITAKVAAEAAMRESESRFRTLLNAVSEVVWAASPDGSQYYYLSPSAEQLFGRAVEDFFQNPSLWLEAVHPEDRQRVEYHLQRLAREERIEDEYRIVRPDGSIRWVHDHKTLVFDEHGAPYQMGGIATDISARIQAEQALMESEIRYQTLFDNTPTGIAYCRMLYDEEDVPIDFVYLDVNPAFASLTGASEVQGKRVTELVPHIRALDPLLFEIYGRVSRQRSVERHDIYLSSLQQWFDISVYSPQQDHFVAVFDIITERKRAEQNLLLFSHRLERLARVVQDLSQARSIEGIAEIVRHAGRELTSSDGTSFVLREGEFCHYVDEDAIAPLWKGRRFPISTCVSGWVMREQAALAIPDIYQDERVPHDAYRPTFVKSLVMAPIRRREPVGAIGSYWATQHQASDEELRILQALADSTSVAMENVRVMAELEHSKARTRAIYEHLPNPTFVWTLQKGRWCLSDFNHAARRLTHDAVSTWEQKTLQELSIVFPDLEKDLIACQLQPVRRELQCVFVPVKQPRRLVLSYGFIPPDMVLLHAEDVTERRLTEEQLRVSQKLEAVGQLAGGVAHDFNNLLSVILSYAGFALAALKESDPLRDDLVEIRDAGTRAAALTRQLLAFSRKQVLEPELLSPNQIIRGLESMLRRLLGEDIRILISLEEQLGQVLVDPGQLEQVIVNLAVNARDAMSHGGTLEIRSSERSISEEEARHAGLVAGGFCVISVSDTGCGMDEETQSHIFEPFFTTKEKGKGTGLGLATVYGIVKQSGGHIFVHSAPQQGTRFDVYLPRVKAARATVNRRSVVMRVGGGTESVLIVEDEDAVRRLTERILKGAGYSVFSSSDADEAIAWCQREGASVALLLTDVVMPKMSGRELAERLVAFCPKLRVLYMSGYTDNAIVHHGVLDASTHFISKPFAAEDLLRQVRETLED